MKKTLLLLAAALSFRAATAQDPVRVSVCTKLWKNNTPITATTIEAYGSAPGFPGQGSQVVLDNTQSCANFEFILSQYPPDAMFSFYSTKEQDDPLNGVTVLDLPPMEAYISGIEPIPALGMIAADANRSNSITTLDYVETRKLLLGINQTWPNNASLWAFFPDYLLPFPNPNNPFQGCFNCPTSLTISQLQALNGGTIEIIGTKRGDVDGDVNTLHSILGPSSDSTALTAPDIILEAGVPTIVPIKVQAGNGVSALQFELMGLPGIVAIDTITANATLTPHLRSNITENVQRSQMRVIFLEDLQVFLSEPIVLNLRLTSNTTKSLKDVLQIRQNPLVPLISDHNSQVSRLYLNFSNAVSTHNPLASGVRLLAAAPNPFKDEAQVTITLDQPESVLLEVMDLTGKLLLSEKSDLAAGLHQLVIPGAVAPQGGVVLYRVTAGAASASGKLVRER